MFTRYIINNTEIPEPLTIVVIFAIGFGLIYTTDFIYRKIKGTKKGPDQTENDW